MSSDQSRREFLKLSAYGVAAVSTVELARALPITMPASGDISVRVTGGPLRYHAEPSVAWKSASRAAGSSRLKV